MNILKIVTGSLLLGSLALSSSAYSCPKVGCFGAQIDKTNIQSTNNPTQRHLNTSKKHKHQALSSTTSKADPNKLVELKSKN